MMPMVLETTRGVIVWVAGDLGTRRYVGGDGGKDGDEGGHRRTGEGWEKGREREKTKREEERLPSVAMKAGQWALKCG